MFDIDNKKKLIFNIIWYLGLSSVINELVEGNSALKDNVSWGKTTLDISLFLFFVFFPSDNF